MNRPTQEEKITQQQYRLIEALHENEKRYRNLLDNLKEVVFQTDADGHWTFLNPAWQEVTGFSVDESLGAIFLENIYPDDRELNFELFKPLIERKKNFCRHEIRFCHKGGGFRWIEVFARLTLDAEDNVVGTTGTLIDITERKQDEVELLEHRRHLEALVAKRTTELRSSVEQLAKENIERKQAEAAALNMMEDACVAREKLLQTQIQHEEAQRIAHLGHWSLDLVNNDLTWSDENYRIFGVVPGTANTYEIFLEIVHPEDYEFVNDAYTGSVKNRTPYDIEHRLLMQDGSIKWVHECCETEYADDGTPLRSIGTTMDITGRRLAENALRLLVEGTASETGEDFFRSLVANLAPALNVRYALVFENVPDRHSVRTLAYWDGEGLGESFEFDPTNTPCENAVRGRSCFYPGKLQALFPKDEMIREMGGESYLGAPFFDASGKVIGHVAVMDTEPMPEGKRTLSLMKVFVARAGAELLRRHAEDELKRHQDHLEETIAERTRELVVTRDLAQAANRAKSTFLANMSHELRTPLNSILGFSELLSLDKVHPLHPDQQTHLGFVLESGSRLLSLINDLLDLSKIEAGKMELDVELFDIRELLNHAIKQHTQTLKKHDISACSDYADDTGLCRGDIQKIHQVLDNLLSNAIKFTPAGGSITVAARRVGLTDITEVQPVNSTDAGIRVDITDTGIGIAQEDQGRLFKPFQQLDGELNRKYEGTGLGLSLCRKIIKIHAGAIWLEQSEPGKGSTFSFVIPAGNPES